MAQLIMIVVIHLFFTHLLKFKDFPNLDIGVTAQIQTDLSVTQDLNQDMYYKKNIVEQVIGDLMTLVEILQTQLKLV